MVKINHNRVVLTQISLCLAFLLSFLAIGLHAQENENGGSFFDEIRLSVGAISLNPFTIENSGTDLNPIFRINNEDTTSRAFFSLGYTNRWAWTSRQSTEFDDTRYVVKPLDLGWDRLVPTDYVMRLGGVFNKDDDELSASTLAGSGDIFGDMSIGWILSGDKENGRSFNLELIGSGVTERGVSEIHERLGLGVAWVKRTAKNHTVVARFSYNRLDTPSQNRQGFVLADASGDPKFEREWGYGFEGEYNISMGESVDGYLTLGVKVFGSGQLDPDPWLVWLGYSVPLDKLKSVLALGNAFDQRVSDSE